MAYSSLAMGDLHRIPSCGLPEYFDYHWKNIITIYVYLLNYFNVFTLPHLMARTIYTDKDIVEAKIYLKVIVVNESYLK